MMQNRKKRKTRKCYLSCHMQMEGLYRSCLSRDSLLIVGTPEEAEILLFPAEKGKLDEEQKQLLDGMKEGSAICLDAEKLLAGDLTDLDRELDKLDALEAAEKESGKTMDYSIEL